MQTFSDTNSIIAVSANLKNNNNNFVVGMGLKKLSQCDSFSKKMFCKKTFELFTEIYIF